MHPLIVFPGIIVSREGLGNAPENPAGDGFEFGRRPGYGRLDKLLRTSCPFDFRESPDLMLPRLVNRSVGSLLNHCM